MVVIDFLGRKLQPWTEEPEGFLTTLSRVRSPLHAFSVAGIILSLFFPTAIYHLVHFASAAWYKATPPLYVNGILNIYI